MKISRRLQRYLVDGLSLSMDVHLMQRLVGQVISGYDLHERSGFPPNYPIQALDAATQVVLDVAAEGVVTQFIEVLIGVDRNGHMGRRISIHTSREIIEEMEEAGFLFSEEYGVFVESRHGPQTIGWGVLKPGINYELTFLSLDIVGNTRLVRRYSEDKIAKAYSDLQTLVGAVVSKRNGRVWRWEGDGGLAAFFFGNKNVQATLTGMELLLELFMYNLFDCPFEEQLSVRIAVHAGPCQFNDDVHAMQNATLDRLHQIESEFTEPDTMTISPGTFTDLGSKLAYFFEQCEVSSRHFLYRYKLEWE